jgi:hypothetical protein
MNLLYFGKYSMRFKKIISLFNKNTKSVVELCFGDIYIARYCGQKGIQWTGYDMNDNFIHYAKKNKCNAIKRDITTVMNWPPSDVCIIMGSLYHFKDAGRELIKKMIQSSRQVIISEPIKNVSSARGLLGFIAKRSANAGKGHEVFRFDEMSFITMISSLNVTYRIISLDKDIIVEISHD